jgi:hypothetical protein
MDDFNSIILITIIAYALEYLKVQFNLSFMIVILFVNLNGLYYFLKNVRVNVTIEYNTQEADTG